MQKVLDDAHKRMKPLLETKQRTLKRTVREHSLPRVAGDEEALLECFLNVFHNAIKYSVGALPVEVKVDYSKWAKQVSVRITNFGIELPQSDWSTIFEVTKRAESATQLAIEGSGLGLFITREFLKWFGGTICVESCERAAPLKDGRPLWRTTFLITLEVYGR
jgi:signal transduction histidine kinase